MKKLFLTVLLLLGVIIQFTGCSSGVERIGLQVQLLKLERKADGALLATLQFSNPNIGSVNLAKSSHQVTLNGKPAGMIEISEPLGLPAQQAVTTAATLKPSAGLGDISGQVSYQLVSSLTLSIYDDNTERFKTSSSGTVTVQ